MHVPTVIQEQQQWRRVQHNMPYFQERESCESCAESPRRESKVHSFHGNHCRLSRLRISITLMQSTRPGYLHTDTSRETQTQIQGYQDSWIQGYKRLCAVFRGGEVRSSNPSCVCQSLVCWSVSLLPTPPKASLTSLVV